MGRIPDEIIQRVRDQADIVELVGRSVEERAAALIEVAHPEHRDALREAWNRVSRSRGSDAFAR